MVLAPDVRIMIEIKDSENFVSLWNQFVWMTQKSTFNVFDVQSS